MNADPVRLSQVFGNLLNNSSKYTPPGGTITVTTAREGGDAVIVVEDTGVGIAADQLENIFDMFSQLDRSGTDVARRARHRADAGAEGWCRCTVARSRPVAPAKARAARSWFGCRLRMSPRHEEPEVVNRPTQARRILVVDDNRDAAESLSMLLSITGHETAMAHDGGAAFDAAEREQPDVVLLDLGLPTLSGYEVCRRIRQQSWGREMFVIALTGWGQDEDRQKTREAGFDGHLVKPVAYDALLRLLDSLGMGSRV